MVQNVDIFYVPYDINISDMFDLTKLRPNALFSISSPVWGSSNPYLT